MVLWKQQISYSGSPHSPISIYLLGISSQELVFPSLPRRGLKGLPHLQCAHFRTSTAQVPSSALFPPAAGMKHGQSRVRTVSPGDSHPCVPTPGELRVPWLSSHVKWTHVIECTWLSARCGQRKELQHPARIRIQIRNLVLTRTFFSFKNTKFELKIFRE